MSVWLTIPSARPPAEVEPVLQKWRAMGYRIALWRDGKDAPIKMPRGPIWSREDIDQLVLTGRIAEVRAACGRDVDLLAPAIGQLRYGSKDFGIQVHTDAHYPGYARAVNALVKIVMIEDPEAEWFIAAGDDTFPDPNHTAEEIAGECRAYFRATHAKLGTPARWPDYDSWGTFGVCQPTGDPWRDVQGRIIERIAGSAWLGREFCKRINQGDGPLWPEYTHCFVDEELQCVAQKYGVFWQRPDLVHHHEHWARKRGNVTDMPAHLVEANSAAHWDKYLKLFTSRKAAGFPGSNPL